MRKIAFSDKKSQHSVIVISLHISNLKWKPEMLCARGSKSDYVWHRKDWRFYMCNLIFEDPKKLIKN